MMSSTLRDGNSLYPLHMLALISTCCDIYALNLSNSQPPPTDRIALVLLITSLAQIFGLLISVHLIRRKERIKEMRSKSLYSSDKNKLGLENQYQMFKELVIILIASISIFYITIVLLGAPILENIQETLSLSYFLTMLAVLPLAIIKPSFNSGQYLKQNEVANICFIDRILTTSPMMTKDPIENFLITTSYLTIFGAWIGVFPIKLDWNLSWQNYPTTCVVGAIVSNCICHSAHLIITSYRNFSTRP